MTICEINMTYSLRRLHITPARTSESPRLINYYKTC
jgi:hypothetical protein